MSSEAGPATFILWFGLLEGLMLGIALFGRRPPSRAAYYLGALLLAVALTLAVPLAQHSGRWLAWPRLMIALSGLPLLFGPLLLAHVAHQVGDRRWLRGRWVALHALLPLLYAILAAWLASHSDAELAALLASNDRPTRPGLLPLAKHLSFLAYSVAALWLLRAYERRLYQQLAETQPHSLRWLRALVWSALGLAVAMWLLRGWHVAPSQVDLVLAVAISGLVLLAGFHGLRQPALFDPLPGATPPVIAEVAAALSEPEPEVERNTAKPPLEDAELQMWLPRLQALGEREDLLFDHSLDLSRLAKALGLSPNQLSYALNTGLGRSFYEYVNGLRVAAVQARMRDPALDQLPILDLAFGCGFSTKTTFNKSFKTVTGLTPSEWRRRARAPGPGVPGAE